MAGLSLPANRRILAVKGMSGTPSIIARKPVSSVRLQYRAALASPHRQRPCPVPEVPGGHHVGKEVKPRITRAAFCPLQ